MFARNAWAGFCAGRQGQRVALYCRALNDGESDAIYFRAHGTRVTFRIIHYYVQDAAPSPKGASQSHDAPHKTPIFCERKNWGCHYHQDE